MSHICLLFSPEDRAFAHHLSVQLAQRGLVVHPVPQHPQPDPQDASQSLPMPDPAEGLPGASHALVIVSQAALAADPEQPVALWQQAQAARGRAILLPRDNTPLPEALHGVSRVRFDGPFLLAFEDLVHQLEKSNAPTRPLTFESPPPVSKGDLLPIKLPAERCWREDRLRINYRLPILIDIQELALRSPAFFDDCGFEVEHESHKLIRARRTRRYPLFDPRRVHHTLTLRPRKGRLEIHYRMARIQVWHWFPAHYRVLDREAAALYRFLVMGQAEPDLYDPVRRQALRARVTSWGTLLAVLLVVVIILLLVF